MTPQITVQASIAADNMKVWNYYTNPEHIIQWNFATEDWTCPSALNDLRIGGKYLARMEAKDGSFGFDFEAVYSEIIAFKKLSYTMTDGRQATINFTYIHNQTTVTITFDAETQNSLDLQKEGWQAILNNFKKYVEQQ